MMNDAGIIKPEWLQLIQVFACIDILEHVFAIRAK